MPVRLPSKTSWALKAWGFANGGRDQVNGNEAVIVDFESNPAEIRGLKENGHVVLCYFSGGTTEAFRKDYKANPALFKSVEIAKMTRWPEYWMNITSPVTKEIFQSRLEYSKSVGCDGVEPDNVDCYSNTECWSKIASSKSEAQALQVQFNKWQTEAAHALDLAIGLKNSLLLAEELVDYYDFGVSESCMKYNECHYWEPFFEQDKAVFHIEYSYLPCSEGTGYPMMTKSCDGEDSLCTSDLVNCFESNGAIVTEDEPLPDDNGVSPALVIFLLIFSIIGIAFARRKIQERNEVTIEEFPCNLPTDNTKYAPALI